jgi:alpha-galactosidase
MVLTRQAAPGCFHFLLLLVGPTLVLGLENGAGMTPPMGWSSRLIGCKASERTIKEAADTLVDLGLAELGYTYLVS